MTLPKIHTPKVRVKLPTTNQEIEFRPYLSGEEKVLLQAKEGMVQAEETKDASVIRKAQIDMARATIDVMNGAVQTPDFDTQNLAMLDFEYLLIQMNINSVSDTSTIQIKCEECGEMNEVEIDLKTIKVPKVSHQNRKIVLDNEGQDDEIGMVLRYPTLNTVLGLDPDLDETDMVYETILDCVDKIYSGESVMVRSEQSSPSSFTLDELRVWFKENISLRHLKDIQEFLGNSPNMEIEVNYTCKHCGHQGTYIARGISDFF